MRLSWHELQAALAQLTDDQRQVVLLKFLEDLDNKQVAAVIGHPAVSAGELTPDSVFHAVVGVAFLVAGLTSPRRMPAGRPA